jgi:ABC-2 type transport system ATP-binding protein
MRMTADAVEYQTGAPAPRQAPEPAVAWGAGWKKES